jgi:hypothetical protein
MQLVYISCTPCLFESIGSVITLLPCIQMLPVLNNKWVTNYDTVSFVLFIYLFYFHISHLGTYHGNGKRHIQYTSSDNLHMV